MTWGRWGLHWSTHLTVGLISWRPLDQKPTRWHQISDLFCLHLVSAVLEDKSREGGEEEGQHSSIKIVYTQREPPNETREKGVLSVTRNVCAVGIGSALYWGH